MGIRKREQLHQEKVKVKEKSVISSTRNPGFLPGHKP